MVSDFKMFIAVDLSLYREKLGEGCRIHLSRCPLQASEIKKKVFGCYATPTFERPV